jgi:hypothetical protein
VHEVRGVEEFRASVTPTFDLRIDVFSGMSMICRNPRSVVIRFSPAVYRR